MYDTFLADLWETFPISLVALVGIAIVVIDVYANDSPWLPVIGVAGLSIAMLIESGRLAEDGLAFSGLLRYGGIAAFVDLVILLSAGLTFVLSGPYLKRVKHDYGEVYALICFATVGMMLMASSNSLITIFVGLETMSICLYALTGLVREDLGATESALKYFLLGAFSTGFFLYGIALLYGATGTMQLTFLGVASSTGHVSVMFWAGAGLLLVGFFFKVSAVPFHMWTPDVYQGAPTTLTGYMSTASKAAAFAALVLVAYWSIPTDSLVWTTTFSVIAAATMIIGNVLAISQSNVKRMLAYSSIAHGGYMLVAVAAGSTAAYAGILYYLLVYSLMNIGAFGVMAMIEWDDAQGREQTLDTVAGIGLKRPFLGVAMAIFMFSLSGFPPLAGFIGKVAVFAPAIDAGLTWLVVVGVLASAVSAFYYLRVLFVFFMKDFDEATASRLPERLSLASAVVIVICALSQLWYGIVPSGILELTGSFFQHGAVAMIP